MAFRRNHSLIGSLFIVLLCGQMFISDYNSVQSAFHTGMNPGMALRLEKQSIDSVKRAMQEFLPKYVEHDMNLPDHYQYQFGFIADVFTWHYKWTDIKYSKPNFDINDIKIDLANTFERPVVKIDFPALKEWKINALQESDSWILPDYSPVELKFEDFDFAINVDPVIKDTGFIDPVVYEVNIKFGNSYFYHDNAIVAFVMHQFLEFAIVIIENSVYFVGQFIFNGMIGPILTDLLNNYKFEYTQPSFFPGAQNTQASLALDFRLTQDPTVGNGFIDFFIVGDEIYNGQGCDIEHDPIAFFNEAESISQFVITQSAMTCKLNKYAQSPIGYFDLDEERFNRLFNVRGIKLDSESISPHLPLFKNKLGGGNVFESKDHTDGPTKLRTMFTFKDINVEFGLFDTDVIVDYTLCLSFIDDSTNKELIYDELRMVTSMNVRLESDIEFIHILNHKLNMDDLLGRPKLPIRNSMSMTENDYREFLSTFGFTLNFLKKWLNDAVLKDGVMTPWNTKEFDTSLVFQEKTMHILIEVEANAKDYFEDRYWSDEDYDY